MNAIKHNEDLAGQIKHEYLLDSSIECIENLMHSLKKFIMKNLMA